MKHNPPHNCPDDALDAVFRSALRRELDVPAPFIPQPQRRTRRQFRDAPLHRLVGGGPGGTPCSGFYLIFYVMNSSRSAWGKIPG